MKQSNPQSPNESAIAGNTAPAGQYHRVLYRLLRGRRRRIIEGLALGTLTGLCAWQLGFNGLLHMEILEDFLILPAIAGLVLALSPARMLLRAVACLAVTAIFIVGYSPLVATLTSSLPHADRLERVPAVVVLSTALRKDGTLDDAGQERALQGYVLLRQGYSDRLVLTRAVPRIGDESAVIRAQMRLLGFNFPTDAVGPVTDTHDEALAVATLARQRGWKRLILITQPWHMRRARAVFLKAGVDILCSPCVEGSYDLSHLSGPGSRLKAFRNWFHETVGFAVYRLRGWL